MLRLSTKGVVAAFVAIVATYAGSGAAADTDMGIIGKSPQSFSGGACDDLSSSKCFYRLAEWNVPEPVSPVRSTAVLDVRDLGADSTSASQSYGAITTSQPWMATPVAPDTGFSVAGNDDADWCFTLCASLREVSQRNSLDEPLRTTWLWLPLTIGVAAFGYRSSRKLV
jgi:hypothetical protein